MENTYLIFLRWPEKCFRASEKDIRFFATLTKGKIVEVKNEHEFLAALPMATHVITWYFKANWYALAKCLVSISTPAAGRELIALPPIDKMVAIHFGHYHGDVMAESVVAFVMAWARGFFFKQPKPWSRAWLGDNRCFEVCGTKAVILGFGHVGRAIGVKLSSVGVEVYGVTHHECNEFLANRAKKLSKILANCDWLILALPSDTGTDDLVNADFIAKLPKRCVIINVGRGNAIDEKALRTALCRKRIAGAYLDVLKFEPHYRRCVDIGDKIKAESNRFINGEIPNAIVMPHAAAFSRKYIQRFFMELKDDGVI